VHGFSLSNGTYTSLNYPGAQDTYAYGINDRGTIVGWYEESGVNYAFSLSNGTYTTLNFPSMPYGINDAGTIVAYYVDASRTHGFLATPVPVPASLLLVSMNHIRLMRPQRLALCHFCR